MAAKVHQGFLLYTVLQIICIRKNWKRHSNIMRCLSQLGSCNWWPGGDKEQLSEQPLSFNWVYGHFPGASKQTWRGCSKGGLYQCWSRPEVHTFTWPRATFFPLLPSSH